MGSSKDGDGEDTAMGEARLAEEKKQNITAKNQPKQQPEEAGWSRGA